jgi:predicted nucleotidyltransferase
VIGVEEKEHVNTISGRLVETTHDVRMIVYGRLHLKAREVRIKRSFEVDLAEVVDAIVALTSRERRATLSPFVPAKVARVTVDSAVL